MSVEASEPATGSPPVRPDVLAYPSATTARYLIFAVALVATGLYLGEVIHTWTLGEEWTRTVSECQARYGGGVGLAEAMAGNEEFTQCIAEVSRARVAVILTTAAVIAVAALSLMFLAPTLVVRRRGLRPLPAPLAPARARFDELAEQAGVTGRVEPMLGRSGQRDAFSFGAPGRYRVALPPAVAVRYRDRALFDPLVSHELAHVLHRDVALAWLTRLVWMVLAPALLLPVLLAPFTGNADSVLAYGWRTGLLAVVVALLSADLLRTREYGADLRAARLRGAVEPVLALVRRTRSPEPTRFNRILGSGGLANRILGSRLLASHPTADDRAAVLVDPGLVTRVGFRDGLTGGFLAALAVPLVVSALRPLFAQLGRSDLAFLLAAGLLGPMLAGAVGLGLGRAALFARVRGGTAGGGGVAAGVALGLVLGQAASLGSLSFGTLSGVSQPVWLVVTGLAGGGAALLTSGLAHVLADATPRLPAVQASWWPTLAFSSLLFSTVLWSTTIFQMVVDLGGWSLGRAAVPTMLSPWWLFLEVWVLAAFAAVLVLLRPSGRPTLVPAWAVDGEPGPWPGAATPGLGEPVAIGLVSGVTGSAAIIAFHAAAGPAAEADLIERFTAYQWVAGLVAASTVVPVLLRRPVRGGGLTLVAAPVTALVVLAGYLALNQAIGGSADLNRADLNLAALFFRPAIGIGFHASLLLAVPAALLAGLRPAGRGVGLGLALVLTTVLAAGVSAATLVGRGAVAVGDLDALADRVIGSQSVPSLPDPAGALLAYERDVAPDIEAGYAAANTAAQRIWSDPATDAVTKSALTGSEVVDPLTELRERWAGFHSNTPDLDEAHAVALEALRTAEERYGLLADAGGVPDQEGLARFAELGEREAGLWHRWQAARVTLAEGLLSS